MNELAKNIETALNAFASHQAERIHSADKPPTLGVKINNTGITITCEGGEDSFFDAGYIANLVIADVWKDTVADAAGFIRRQAVTNALAALRAEMYDYTEQMSRTLSGDAAKDWLKKIDATIAALDLPVAKEKANG